MLFDKNLWKLTKRDMEILSILWDSSESMTASQIVASRNDLTMNTVQAILRKLLKRELIEVADIVYSGTVLSRSYKPSISQSDFIARQFRDEILNLQGKLTPSDFVLSLLNTESDPAKARKEIEELEQILQDFRKHVEETSSGKELTEQPPKS